MRTRTQYQIAYPMAEATGASVMGSVFALASGTVDLATAPPEAVDTGMRSTFLLATEWIAVALSIAVGSPRSRQAVS